MVRAGRTLHLPYRIRDRRHFAISLGLQKRGNKKKKSQSLADDVDPFEVLEQAARRTTTTQIIDPSISLRPGTPLGGQSTQVSQQATRQPPATKANLKNQKKKQSRGTSQTRKHLDEKEAAAFLEEATKRVAGRVPSELPKRFARLDEAPTRQRELRE